MSLDLYLFEQQSGEEPSDTIETILEEEEERLGNDEDGEPSVPEPFKQVLHELNEKYKWSEFDPESNALSHDKYGMTLEAYSKYFVINIAFWHEGEGAAEVANFANNVIQTCRRHIPCMLIYDLQEDEVKESLISVRLQIPCPVCLKCLESQKKRMLGVIRNPGGNSGDIKDDSIK